MKSLDLQNTKDLILLKEEIEKILSKRIAESQKNDTIESIDAMPFGVAKCLFESVSDKLFSSDKGKSLIGKYIKAIKENKALCKEYAFYNLVSHPQTVSNVSEYLIEAKKLCEGVASKACKESEDRVKAIVKECLKEVEISNEEINTTITNNKVLNETVDYYLKNPVTYDNLRTYVDKFQVLQSIVAENQSSDIVLENNEKSVKELVSELNEKFNGDLTVWENRVVKDISLANISNTDKKDLFESYKNDCLSAINERLENSEIEDKSQFFTMKTQLESKNYNADTIVEDLLRLSELKNLITED